MPADATPSGDPPKVSSFFVGFVIPPAVSFVWFWVVVTVAQFPPFRTWGGGVALDAAMGVIPLAVYGWLVARWWKPARWRAYGVLVSVVLSLALTVGAIVFIASAFRHAH